MPRGQRRLARVSHTLAGAGLVLAAPTGFRTLVTYRLGRYPRFWRRRENLLARQRPTLPWAIIPQQDEKSGQVTAGLVTEVPSPDLSRVPLTETVWWLW
jgi:hypothetical protein